MSGHPHKGKRSEWTRFIIDFPPRYGVWERECAVCNDPPHAFFFESWSATSYCSECQWRGLAEKPK